MPNCRLPAGLWPATACYKAMLNYQVHDITMTASDASPTCMTSMRAGEFAVLYCWEVQVEDRAQRKGLGRFLMQLLELIGRR